MLLDPIDVLGRLIDGLADLKPGRRIPVFGGMDHGSVRQRLLKDHA
jgi:hypothetical protein